MEKSSERLPRCLLVGGGIGAVAGSVAYFVTQGVGWAVGQASPSPDANIGLGIGLMVVTPILAGLLAWPGLRWSRVPGAGLSCVFAVVCFYVLLVPVTVMTTAVVDPAPPMGFIAEAAVPMAVATVVGVLIGRAIALRGHDTTSA